MGESLSHIFNKKILIKEERRSIITQIGGTNNIQNIKAGGKINIVGSKNNIQNIEAGDDIIVVATQIGGKGNIQRIE